MRKAYRAGGGWVETRAVTQTHTVQYVPEPCNDVIVQALLRAFGLELTKLAAHLRLAAELLVSIRRDILLQCEELPQILREGKARKD